MINLFVTGDQVTIASPASAYPSGMTGDVAGGFGPHVEVLSSEPVPGGFSGASKFRLRALLTEHDVRVERTLLLKQTSQVEVNALTAAARVPGTDAVPEVIATGANRDGPYVLTAFYPGEPAADETSLPTDVIRTLARLHAYYQNAPVPEGVPVIDSDWWRAKCDLSAQRLRSLPGSVAQDLGTQVQGLKEEQAMLAALDELPRTLIHGDLHHNNVLVDADGHGHIIDWGGSFIGAAALDLSHLGEPDSAGHRTYLATWQELTGERLAESADWARSCVTATVWANIKYLAFATKIFGDERGLQMMASARSALAQL